MALNLVVFSADPGSGPAIYLKTTLEDLAHAVMLVADSAIGSTDVSAYDVVITTRTTYANRATIGAQLRQWNDAGKPLLVGLLDGGTPFGSGQESAAGVAGYIGSVHLVSYALEPTARALATAVDHPILDPYPSGQTVPIYRANQHGVALDSGAPYAGTLLATADPGTSLAGRPAIIAIDAGENDLNGTPVGARVVVSGFLYGSQTVKVSGRSEAYSNQGEQFYDRCLRWLTGQSLRATAATSTDFSEYVTDSFISAPDFEQLWDLSTPPSIRVDAGATGGKIARNPTGGTDQHRAYAWLAPGGTLADGKLTSRIRVPDGTIYSGLPLLGVALRTSGHRSEGTSIQDLRNAYVAAVRVDSNGAAALELFRVLNNVRTDLSAPVPITLTRDVWHQLAIETVGTEIRAKIWPDGVGEPAWQASGTDAALASGWPALYAYAFGGSSGHAWDTLNLTPAATNTPPTAGFIASVENRTVTVTSTATDAEDPGGVPATVEYDYGDGSGWTTASSHTYADGTGSSFTITQRATDSAGLQNTAQQAVTLDTTLQITSPTANQEVEGNQQATWTAQTGADHYEGSLRRQGTATWQPWFSGETNLLRALPGLDGGLWEIRVEAIDASGTLLAADEVAFRVRQEVVPLAPEGGANVGLCSPIITLQWRGPDNASFNLDYERNGAGDWQPIPGAQNLNVGEFQWDTTGLSPNSYRVRISGTLADGTTALDPGYIGPFTVGDTPAVDLTPAPVHPTTLAHLEVWSDLERACGVRLGFLRPIYVPGQSPITIEELGGQERLLFQAPIGAPGWAHVVEKRVIRAVFRPPEESGRETWAEWRIVRVATAADESDARTGSVECESPLYDLGSATVEEVQANGTVEHAFDRFGLTPFQHLEAILGYARPYLRAGSIEATEALDLSYRGTSLAMVDQLADATALEYELVRTVSGHYRLDARERIGADAPTVMLRFRRNERSLQYEGDAGESYQRVTPLTQAEDGLPLHMGDAQWQITAVAAAAGPNGGDLLQLAGGPIGFDNQLDGLHAELASNPAQIRQISATLYATQQIEVPAGETWPVGELVRIRRDNLGTQLTFLEHPEARALYGGPAGYAWRTVLERSDIPPIDNLQGFPFVDRWDETGPLGYTAVAGAAITKNTAGLYRRYGDASARVVAAAAGDGLQGDWYPVAPTAQRPHASAQAALFVVSGQVRLVWEIQDAAGAVSTVLGPNDPGFTSRLNEWTDVDKALAVGGIDLQALGAVAFRLRLEAKDGPAEWYVDALQVTQQASPPPSWYDGLASNDLWRAANAFLREHAHPRRRYRGSFADLERLAPGRYPGEALRKGALVRLTDERLGIDVYVRIVGLRRDLYVPRATDVELASRKPDLTQVVIEPVRRTERSSLALPAAPPDGGGDGESEPPAPPSVSAGSISSFRVTVRDFSPITQHDLAWDHNQTVQDDTGGRFTVDCTYQENGGTVFNLFSGRDPRLEKSNNDSSPAVGGYQTNYNSGTGQWVDVLYTLTLRDAGTAVGTPLTERASYRKPAPGDQL